MSGKKRASLISRLAQENAELATRTPSPSPSPALRGMTAINSAPSGRAAAPPPVGDAADHGALPNGEKPSERLEWIETHLIDLVDYHNRVWVDDIEELAITMKGRQQVEPARVRPNQTVSGRYELFVGRRRLEAAKLNGEPLLCIVSNDDDGDAFIKMWNENTARKDLSAIEEAKSLQLALDNKLFPNITQMALKIGVERTTLLNRLMPAQLPAEVIQAIRKPKEIDQMMAVEMVKLIKEGFLEEVINIIPVIESQDEDTGQKISVRSLRAEVTALRANPTRIPGESPQRKRRASERIKNRLGMEVCRARVEKDGSWTLVFPKGTAEDVRSEVKKFLEALNVKPPTQS